MRDELAARVPFDWEENVCTTMRSCESCRFVYTSNSDAQQVAATLSLIVSVGLCYDEQLEASIKARRLPRSASGPHLITFIAH